MCRMARSCAFLVFLWVAGLQLTSSNVIDQAYSRDGIGEDQDLRVGGDAAEQLSDKGRLRNKLERFIEKKNLEKRCTEKATKKTEQLAKEREKKDKCILRHQYQILQHGRASFASKKEWLSAKRSEICTRCLLKKICKRRGRRLRFLPKYVSFSFWKSLKLRLFDVKLLLVAKSVLFLLSKCHDHVLSEMAQKRLIRRLTNINLI